MATAFSVVVNIGANVASSFGSAVGKAKAQIGKLGDELAKAQAQNKADRNSYRLQIGDAAALGASLYGLIKPAVEFESSMADVKKVVDFDTPEQFKQMGADVLAMSQRIPMAANGLAQIVAAAGQSGIAKDELLGFAEAAAKMGIAFDISADEAGTTMAQWRTAMKLTQPQVEALADAVNQLSNEGASKASDIADVLRRVGGLAVTTGLSAQNTAALGSAMLSAGATSDVAATALKTMVMSMSAGSSATDKQAEAFKKLGFNTERLAKNMQKDAVGSIVAVMEALKELPQHEQIAVASEIFGKESLGAISPMLSNLDALKAAFKTTSKETNYLGSAQKEYDARSATTANNLQLFRNRVSVLGITIGSILLPALNDTLAFVGPLVTKVADLAGQFPIATKVIAGAAVGLISLKIATIGAGYAWTFLKGAALSTSSVVVSAVGMMGRAMLTLLNPMALVRGALFALKVAVIGTGIGAVVVGLAMAGTWIYNNWSNLAAMFDGFGTAFMAALGPARPMVEGVIASISSLWQWVSNLLGPIEGAEGGFRSFGERVGAAVGGAVVWVMNLGGKIAELPGLVLGAIGGLASAIGTAFAGIVSAALPSFDAVRAGFDQGIIRGITALLTNFHPGAIIGTALNEIVLAISGINLFESGRALLSTFVDGISSMLDKPAELVKGALESVRNLLPFSDAKEGPLSELTRSGAAVLPTFGEGIAKEGPGAASGPLAGALGAALGAAMAVAPAMATGAPLPPGVSAPPALASPLPPIESLAIRTPSGTAPGGAGGPITVNAPITLNVPPGAKGDEIARLVREEVERIIDEAAARQRSALHD
ncbi:phage tail tape measure protein [Azospirillum sp. TSH64]|uniref:phage tail tape measure protein n=1 Tax=Azospirillum sp. TSH64 TaxID=652740 RepID=UPI000D65BA77|nr:phage tail tape measure protein [Azospirillum sp. TSH64]